MCSWLAPRWLKKCRPVKRYREMHTKVEASSAEDADHDNAEDLWQYFSQSLSSISDNAMPTTLQRPTAGEGGGSSTYDEFRVALCFSLEHLLRRSQPPERGG